MHKGYWKELSTEPASAASSVLLPERAENLTRNISKKFPFQMFILKKKKGSPHGPQPVAFVPSWVSKQSAFYAWRTEVGWWVLGNALTSGFWLYLQHCRITADGPFQPGGRHSNSLGNTSLSVQIIMSPWCLYFQVPLCLKNKTKTTSERTQNQKCKLSALALALSEKA